MAIDMTRVRDLIEQLLKTPLVIQANTLDPDQAQNSDIKIFYKKKLGCQKQIKRKKKIT